jgi:hypothetical protein
VATPKGGYFTAAGEKVPSVTTILGRFKDSGGLMFWAHKVGAEQRDTVWRNRVCAFFDKWVPAGMKGLEFWGKLISPANLELLRAGLWEPAPEQQRLYDVSEAAAASGTLAHDAIEWFIKTQSRGLQIADAAAYEWPPGIDPTVLLHAQNAYAQFLEWFHQTSVTIQETETGSVSERHKYGGTLDGLGKDAQGRYVLLDWKTSNAIYPDYLIQLAAYALLLEENHGIKVERYYIVRVAKENADFNHASFADLENEKSAFLLMRELYARVEAIQKRVR